MTRLCDRWMLARAMMQMFRTSWIKSKNQGLQKGAEEADVPQHATSTRQERLHETQLLQRKRIQCYELREVRHGAAQQSAISSPQG